MKNHRTSQALITAAHLVLVVGLWVSGCSSTSSVPELKKEDVFRSRGADVQDPLASAQDYLSHGIKPQLIASAAPIYPKDLIASRAEGVVIVDFIVTDEGKVTGAYALVGARQEFAESAVQAVRQWVYTPGTLRGRRVAVRMQQEFRFKPSEPNSESSASRLP